MRILVAGATGYIGGRLVPQLLEMGHQVRCLARRPEKLERSVWRDKVEVVAGDVLDPVSIAAAMDGCDVAYYLIHSMEDGADDFEDTDRIAATNFRKEAEAAELSRIVYLGGLGRGSDLSKHLASRQEVGRVLADGPVPVTELRAAVIIGSGSVSFEMLRYLTEVLPVMITPTWVRTKCQPIAVADVLDLLVDAADESSLDGHVREIGGPDKLSYEDMIRVYAEVAGLPRRWIIPVPFLSPGLSSHWVGLVTPLPASVAKPLVASLRVEVTVEDNSHAEQVARALIPYRAAVARALRNSTDMEVPTRWSDASNRPALPMPEDPSWSGGTVLTDEQIVESHADAADLFWAFIRIGGGFGYYTMNWAWGIRGLVDALAGGVGLRRGRRHPEELRVDEALDFWRVAKVSPGSEMQIYAEMKLPGDAWLSFRAEPTPSGARLVQTAVFVPRGLLGRLYWIAMTPFHSLIFGRMAREIAAAAESRSTDGSRSP